MDRFSAIRQVLVFTGVILHCFALGQTIVLNKIYTPEHVAELVQKDIAKQKKKGKPTLIEKMAEAQMIQLVRILLRSESHFLTMRITMSLRRKQKTELKDEQRRRLNEARKRMAEKYGDE